jgi:hypothetical protein
MNFGDMALFIPLLAAAYLLSVYVILMLAQRPRKESSSGKIGKASN